MVFLIQTIQANALSLISKSHTSIRLERVGEMMGMEKERVLPMMEERGWGFDSEMQMLYPRERESQSGKEVTSQLLHRLAEYAVFLEESISAK